MDLSIAIVSYNVRELLAECLSSVEESGRPLRQEVIVVDNASHDGSADMVQKRFPNVTLIRNSQNLGFARASNQALRVSQGRYLLLLNPDTIVVGDCLPRMVEFMDAHPECGAAICRIWLDTRREWSLFNFLTTHLWREVLLSTRLVGRGLTPRRVLERHWRRCWQVSQTREPCQVEAIMGPFFLVRREVFRQVGGLDERFFMYYEDIDWSRRIRERGWKLFFHPGVGIVHHGCQSSVREGDWLAVAGQQSKWRYLRKHFGWTGAAFVHSLVAVDVSVHALLRLLGLIRENGPRPIGTGVPLDLRLARPSLSWPTRAGATHYLVEIGIEPLFLLVAARFVATATAVLPVEDLRKPGFQKIYWRAVPFRGDEPMPPWVHSEESTRPMAGRQ